MEIKRIGENKIRCALTEDEIREMGFEIEDMLADGERIQEFMKLVLERVEQEEDINLEHVSPVVRAELLPDHSMAITFGGKGDMDYKDLMESLTHLMKHIDPEKIKEFEKRKQEEAQESSKKKIKESMTCALKFLSMDAAIGLCRTCFNGSMPQSSLYKMDEAYYLALDFTGIGKEEMRAFAFSALEYDQGHYSDDRYIAHIKEHGTCIVKKDAIQMLKQL